MLHHKPLTMGQSATSEIPPPHPAPAGSLGHARQRELAKGQASAESSGRPGQQDFRGLNWTGVSRSSPKLDNFPLVEHLEVGAMHPHEQVNI